MGCNARKTNKQTNQTGSINSKIFTDAGSPVGFISQEIINNYEFRNQKEKSFGLFLFVNPYLRRLEGLRKTTNVLSQGGQWQNDI
jgi:hypothetical protein